MAGVQRTPPKSSKTPVDNISQSQTRSEPDITTAVAECEYVSTQRSSKRPRKNTSPQSISAGKGSQEPQDLREILADQTTLIAELSSDIKDIKTQNSKIQATNSEICKANAGIVQSIDFLNKQFEDLKTEVDILRRERREQQTYIESLERKIVDLQHKSRSSAIELRNIPQVNNESCTSLLKTVCDVGTAIGVSIDEKELRDIYRLPVKSTSSSSPRPIITEFSTVQTKQTFLTAVRNYNKGKGKYDKLNTAVIGLSGDPQPVYISDHLPASTKKLFFQAREFANKNKFKFCWISNGNIFLRKIEGDKQILVNSEKCFSLLDSQNLII